MCAREREGSVAFSRYVRTPGNRVVKERPEIVEGENPHARARGDGRGRRKEKKRLNTSGKWYKIYPYFFKGFAATVVGPNPGFRFDEFFRSAYFSILLLPSTKAHTVQSQPLNTNVNALGFSADFLLLHFALLATDATSLGGGGHFHGRFRNSSWETEGAGRGLLREGASPIAERIEIFPSYTFSVPSWPSRTAHK